MKKYAEGIAALAAFAAVVNIVNIFSNDAALGLILIGFCGTIYDIGFYVCHGYHIWQNLGEEE